MRERLGPSLKKKEDEEVKEDILDKWIIQKVVEQLKERSKINEVEYNNYKK